MLQIPQMIEQARVSAGLTQTEMAKKLGIKRSTYQYWESNTPSLDKLQQIIEVLKLPNDYFFVSNDETSTNDRNGKAISKDEFEVTVKEYIEALREQKRQAEDHRKSVEDRAHAAEKHAQDLKDIITTQLSRIDTNLSSALAGVFQQSLRMEAASTTVLKSLARLEKKKEDVLVNEAGKIQNERLQEYGKQGNNVYESKQSNP